LAAWSVQPASRDVERLQGRTLRETARRLALEYTYLTRRLMDAPGQ
jgi:hypothetical protein